MNRTPLDSEIERKVAFVDATNMIAGFNCGRHVLPEDTLRGDFLSYVAIYDLNEMLLSKYVVDIIGNLLLQ